MSNRTAPYAQVLLCVVFLALSAVAPARAAAQEHPGWWDGAWRYRKLVRVGEDLRGTTAARVWLHLRPEADNGGRDLRVVGPDGRPVRFGIAHATPQGRYLLGFELRGRGKVYAVYYGNPRAEAVEQTLPARGLIYETRPIPEEPLTDGWAAARQTIERAGAAYGAGYRGRVFDAYNPFGPQEDYIGIYRGYLRCPETGTYRFATISDHSSFLLVDGQLVTQWVGDHNIWRGRRGQHSGSVELRRGFHRFQYVHFAVGGPGRAVAAWIPPGEKWWEVIPSSAFPMPTAAEAYECERFDQPLCADFASEPLRYLEAGDARMTALQFRSLSTATGGLIRNYRWDFGDGQASSAPGPRHVYLAPGVYPVRLTVTSTAGQTTSCAKNVRIEPIRHDLNFGEAKREWFLRQVRRYRLDRLPTPCLVGAWEFFRDMEERDPSFEAARLLDGRREQLPPVQLHEVAMHLGEHYQAREKRYDLAEKYLKLARDSVPEADRARRLDARCALAEHYLRHRDDPERARQEYVRLRADFSDGDPKRLREALIAIGDTWRRQGKLEKALEAYTEAEGDPAYAPARSAALVKGAALQQVESHLRDGEADGAVKELEELLWQFPTMRLEGRPALLRVRAELVRGDFREARRRAETYLGFAKDPNYVPAVHVEAAEACLELGFLDEAEEHFRTVLDHYPESPESRAAENGLRRLGL